MHKYIKLIIHKVVRASYTVSRVYHFMTFAFVSTARLVSLSFSNVICSVLENFKITYVVCYRYNDHIHHIFNIKYNIYINISIICIEMEF